MSNVFTGLIVVGFHRSLTSLVSNWLHQSGMSMGQYLYPAHFSNPDGHFESAPFVGLHDRLLARQGTDWRFHGELIFDPCERMDLMRRYIDLRSHQDETPWGAKDPRVCLFLPAWREVLGEGGRYLVVLRHWAGSVESLLRRHSQVLAFTEASPDGGVHASFWHEPELAARMWLAYYRSILEHIESCPEQVLIVTHQSILSGLPLIEVVNAHFGLHLDTEKISPLRSGLSHPQVDPALRRPLSEDLLKELEDMWQALVDKAHHRAQDENALWMQPTAADAQLSAWLQTLVEPCAVAEAPVVQEHDDNDLDALFERIQKKMALPLDSAHVLARVESEARFSASHWEKFGRALLLRGHVEVAEQAFVRLLLCGHIAPYVYMLLGQCREAEFDFVGAEHYYAQAIQRNPKNPAFHVCMANLRLVLGERAQGEALLRAAMQTLPDHPVLLQALAQNLDQQGRTTEAVELLMDKASTIFLQRLLLTLRMKLDHATGQLLYAQHVQEIVARPETREALSALLCSVEDTELRYDLACRIIGHYRDHGIDVGAWLDSPPSAVVYD